MYRVHSGQLGTSAQSVESALSSILRRAARWDSILLIDEADVYIRRRATVICSIMPSWRQFLRTLEYFDGLLFMTTNRVDDVVYDADSFDAGIAVIRYEIPPKDRMPVRLWKSLSEQFQVEIVG